jgi:hypothetical protein
MNVQGNCLKNEIDPALQNYNHRLNKRKKMATQVTFR